MWSLKYQYTTCEVECHHLRVVGLLFKCRNEKCLNFVLTAVVLIIIALTLLIRVPVNIPTYIILNNERGKVVSP